MTNGGCGGGSWLGVGYGEEGSDSGDDGAGCATAAIQIESGEWHVTKVGPQRVLGEELGDILGGQAVRWRVQRRAC